MDTTKVIKGHDYQHGIDVEMTRAEWRDVVSSAAYTRRVGGDLLTFMRRADGSSALTYEIYDDGTLSRPRRQEV